MNNIKDSGNNWSQVKTFKKKKFSKRNSNKRKGNRD